MYCLIMNQYYQTELDTQYVRLRLAVKGAISEIVKQVVREANAYEVGYGPWSATLAYAHIY